MNFGAIGVAVVVGGAALLHLASFAAKRYERISRTRLLSDRPSLSVDEMFATHFGHSGIAYDDAKYSVLLIAAVLHVEPGRLRPSDRLQDLSGKPWWYYCSEDISDLADELAFREHRQEHLGYHCPDDEVTTID